MIARKLLVESSATVLTMLEGTGNKLIARGEFGRVGVPTDNGRIYPERLMKREITRLNEDLKSRKVLGELDHPSDGKTSLKRVSHVITNLEITKDGIIMGEAEILNTHEGKNLKALIEGGVRIGVSSRGFGSTAPSSGKDEAEEVQDDFVLKTYDFVADPAMKSAVPEIYTEDVDDPTIAQMFLAEFPDVAETIKGGSAIVEEKKEKPPEDQIEARLTEAFERKLKDALLAQRSEVEREVREELTSDPAAAGAKAVLEAIADMVGVYRKNPDTDAVKAALKAKDLEVSEAVSERDKALFMAQKAAYMLHAERKIGKHPMAESIRKLIKGRDFASLTEADEAINAITADLPDVSEVVTKDEARYREENAALRSKSALLESKVEELEAKVLRAAKLGERIDEQRQNEVGAAEDKIALLEDAVAKAEKAAKRAAVMVEEAEDRARERVEAAEIKAYKLEKVVGFTNGRELLGLMENVQDRRVVDDVVEKRGLKEFGDPMLNRARAQVKGRSGTRIRLDEEEESPRKSTNELGQDMDELAILSGISPMV